MSPDEHERETALSDSCTVIVCSCDAYCDLWDPCTELYRRFWPDMPFRAVLLSETTVRPMMGFEVYPAGRGLKWSGCLLKALEQVSTPNVLLALDDFFLRERVDTPRLLRLLDAKTTRRLDMLRLIPRPGPDQVIERDLDYGIISNDADYRVSTQAAFWTTSVLQGLLRPHESIWEFEIEGTKRSRGQGTFACVYKSAFPYRHHVVERGKWFPWAAREFARQGVGIDLVARKTMSPAEATYWLGRKAVGTVTRWVPRQVRRRLKRLLVPGLPSS
jgi:hypothetical protein